jgi:hypothetical protein
VSENQKRKDEFEGIDKTVLAHIAATYEKEKWMAAASKYYDQTGKRISREKAQKAVEALRR